MSKRRIPKVCPQCNTVFQGREEQRFCSSRCGVRNGNNIRELNPRPVLEMCGNEHPLTEDNTYVDPTGRTHCRECRRARHRDAERKRAKRPPAMKARRPVKPEPAPVVETTGTYRPVWRPPGFVLRPGDEGYDGEVAS